MLYRFSAILASILLSICVVFSSCASDPGSFSFVFDDLMQNVEDIELINYEIAEVKTVKSKEDILSFNFNKVTLLEKIEENQKTVFLNEFSKITFHVSDNLTRYSNSAKGISIRLIYQNGNFLVMCWTLECNFVTLFVSDGTVGDIILRFVDPMDFVNLINRNFETQIPEVEYPLG